MQIFQNSLTRQVFGKTLAEHQAVVAGAVAALEHEYSNVENSRAIAEALRRTMADIGAFAGDTRDKQDRIKALVKTCIDERQARAQSCMKHTHVAPARPEPYSWGAAQQKQFEERLDNPRPQWLGIFT